MSTAWDAGLQVSVMAVPTSTDDVVFAIEGGQRFRGKVPFINLLPKIPTSDFHRAADTLSEGGRSGAGRSASESSQRKAGEGVRRRLLGDPREQLVAGRSSRQRRGRRFPRHGGLSRGLPSLPPRTCAPKFPRSACARWRRLADAASQPAPCAPRACAVRSPARAPGFHREQGSSPPPHRRGRHAIRAG